MRQSDQIAELMDALAQAQAEMPTLHRDRTATVSTKSGGSFSYKFVDGGQLLAAALTALSKHGIAVLQFVESDDEHVTVTTRLAKGAEWIESMLAHRLDLIDPQRLGSLLTYLKRYGLQALAGVPVMNEDDDASAARLPARRVSDGGAASTRTGEVAAIEQDPAVLAGLELAAAGGLRVLTKALNALTQKQRACIGVDRIRQLQAQARALGAKAEAGA